MSRRTATINQIRAFLIEQGITVRKGLRALKNSFETILEQRKDEISPECAKSCLVSMVIGFGWMTGLKQYRINRRDQPDGRKLRQRNDDPRYRPDDLDGDGLQR